MPEYLRAYISASELVEEAVRQDRDDIANWIGLEATRQAIHDERDRKANRPIPTPVGDLIPGDMVDIKSDDLYGSKRTIKGAVVSPNTYGLTTLDPASLIEVHLERGGQSLRVRQRTIVEIKVVGPRREPVRGR